MTRRSRPEDQIQRAVFQHLRVRRARPAGAYCCIAEGLDRALAVLEPWGLLRGQAIAAEKWDSRYLK
jgi:hypothetical protein